jgi:hypothetical protein
MKNMKRYIPACLLFCSTVAGAQPTDQRTAQQGRLHAGINAGIGTSFTDKAVLFTLHGGVACDYFFIGTWYLRLAPEYTWLIRWNEHYLTFPVQAGRKMGRKMSFYAGPAVTFDIGYFRNLGLSAGADYHFGKRSAIMISAFTFTLFDYHVDYVFIPVSISYHYRFIG